MSMMSKLIDDLKVVKKYFENRMDESPAEKSMSNFNIYRNRIRRKINFKEVLSWII